MVSILLQPIPPPALGAQNEEVFNDLGVSSDELKNLKRQGII